MNWKKTTADGGTYEGYAETYHAPPPYTHAPQVSGNTSQGHCQGDCAMPEPLVSGCQIGSGGKYWHGEIPDDRTHSD